MNPLNWTLGILIGVGLLAATVVGGMFVPNVGNACEGLPVTQSYGEEATGWVRVLAKNEGSSPTHYRVCLMDAQGVRERVNFMVLPGDEFLIDMQAPPREVAYGIAHGVGGFLSSRSTTIQTVDLSKCPQYTHDVVLVSKSGVFGYGADASEGCGTQTASAASRQGAPVFGGDLTAPGSPPLSDRMAGAAFVGTLSIGLFAVLWNRFPLVRVVVIGLFTRLTEPELLKQDRRARIHELVRHEPGIHASKIAARLELAHGVVDYHLAVLVRSQLLQRFRYGGLQCYFEHGRFALIEMRRLTTLRSERLTLALDIVRRNPGLTQGSLARRLSVSTGRTSKIVRRLEEAGLLSRKTAGRQVFLHATPLTR